MEAGRIFLSWSGQRSKAVAVELRSLIVDLCPEARPWMSEQDLASGRKWDTEIESVLRESSSGVICVTRDNLQSPWLYFELGMLRAKLGPDASLCPYLIGIEPTELGGTPLQSFQAKRAVAEETARMIEDLAGDVAGLKQPTASAVAERWTAISTAISVAAGNIGVEEWPDWLDERLAATVDDASKIVIVEELIGSLHSRGRYQTEKLREYVRAIRHRQQLKRSLGGFRVGGS